jgi:hypothetical protein
MKEEDVLPCVISGIRRVVVEICALVACYTALQTFRDNLSVPFSRVKNVKGIGLEITSTVSADLVY